MLKNLAFALLFAYFTLACSPRQYVDSTGNYTKLHGKFYLKDSDSLTAKGYPVYRLTSYKERTFNGQTVIISKR